MIDTSESVPCGCGAATGLADVDALAEGLAACDAWWVPVCWSPAAPAVALAPPPLARLAATMTATTTTAAMPPPIHRPRRLPRGLVGPPGPPGMIGPIGPAGPYPG